MASMSTSSTKPPQGDPRVELKKVLSGLSQRDLLILKTRVLNPGRRTTLEDLGNTFGVTRERIRQVETNLSSKLTRLRGPHFSGIQSLANQFSTAVGSAAPTRSKLYLSALEHVRSSLGDPDQANFGLLLVLWLAGPYQEDKEWLTSKQADQADINLDLSQSSHVDSVIPDSDCVAILNDHCIKPQFHRKWLRTFSSFLVVDDGVIYANGSFLDRAERLLRHVRRPMNPSEMVPLLGTVNIRGMRDRMTNDPRFWRVSVRGDMVLAGTPGYQPYTTITKEVAQLIRLGGGQANRNLIIDYLHRQFGVSKSSVVTFMNTPNFARLANGNVAMRAQTDLPVSRAQISKTRDCFFIDGDWGFRVMVDNDRRRGSGFSCPNPFASLMGCPLGKKIKVHCRFGTITLSWRKDSPTGASMGSVKSVVDQEQLMDCEHLFVVGRLQKGKENATDPYIEFIPLRFADFEKLSGWPLAARLMGIRDVSASEPALLAAMIGALAPDDSSTLDDTDVLGLKQQVLELLGTRKDRFLLEILGEPSTRRL